MQNVESILKTRIENNEADTFVVIVPTDSARLNRQRELIDYHPNRAVANLQVYNLYDFIQRLYNQVRPAKTLISSGIQNLWLNEITGNDSNHYDAFRPVRNKPIPDSTLSLIANTINNLKEKGETAQDIETKTPTQTDLSHIYNRYESKLQDRWIDEKGKHLNLANNFEDDYLTNAFRRVNLVVVESFSVLSKSDIKILTRIAEMSDIEMWFRTDCIEENPDLYNNIITLVSQFRSAGCYIDTDFDRDDDRHKHFSEYLFNSNNPSFPPIDVSQQITELKPADRTEEIEQIAHLIQKHVSSGDCKLGDICVAYYSLSQYQQRIAEIFHAFGIPFSLTENTPLTKSEVVKAIFSRLSSQQKPIDDTYFSDVNPASPTHTFLPNELQEYVNILLNTGEVLNNILNSMLQKDSTIVEGEVNALQAFKRIVNELCEVLEADEGRSHQLDYYVNKLHYIAKHTTYQSRAQTKSETVKIVTLGELRSLEFDIVFLGDFVDGGFPANYRPDPLLPDTPYRTEEEQLHDNRFLFYRVLKAYRERLYLLVPQREKDAELIPSLFLSQLQEIAKIGTEQIENPTQRSVPGFLSAYGNHVWTVENPSYDAFPEELDDQRSLIDHVVSIEKSREDTHVKLAYEGMLKAGNLSEESQAQLEKQREKNHSVTELETYANCPFQYYIDKVMGYKVEEDEEDEPSTLEKGTLIHDVLFKLFSDRRESNLPEIAKCSEEDIEQALRHLDEVLHHISEEKRLDRKDKEISEDNLFWKIEIEKQQVALHKWLDAEKNNDLPLMPSYFEVSIGRTQGNCDVELSQQEPVSIGNVNMTGKIDRIDVGAASLNVIDYKTGSSKIAMQDILEGRSIQLPIYLQVAQKLLEQNGKTGLESAAGLYHKIRMDEFRVEMGIGIEDYNGVAFRFFNGTEWKEFSKSGQLLYEEQFNSRLDRVNGYVQQFVENISNGIFPLITRVDTFVDSVEEGDTPLTPKDPTKPCSYCAYKRICRVGAFVESYQVDT